VRTIGAVRDITEQRQAEEEQKKLATLVAMNRDAIGIMTTLEGRLVYLNHAAMTLFGAGFHRGGLPEDAFRPGCRERSGASPC
jgi:PAS domain-containing protein